MLSHQIDNEGRSNSAAWPLKLIEALPSLLKKLLECGKMISLERLQLVSLDIALDEAGVGDEPFALVREKEGAHGFVLLRGQLALSEGRAASVVIRYAERGAKKFFFPKMTDVVHEARAVAPITASDVRDFYKAVGLDNPLFYDAKLAELNGFPSLFVPVELLMLRLIEEADVIFGESFKRYSFSFWQAIPQDAELCLSVGQDKRVLVLKAGKEEMVRMVLS